MLAVTRWVWALFWTLVLAMIVVDLAVDRHRRASTLRSAALWIGERVGSGSEVFSDIDTH